MPRLRALIASVLGGLLVFAVIGFWLRWPMFLSVTLAALLGVVFLMMAAALDDDGVAEDVAWRAAAADLLGGDREASPATEPADRASAADPAAVTEPAGVMEQATAGDAAGESEITPEARADDEPSAEGEPLDGGEPDGEPIPASEPLAPALIETEAEP